MAGEQQKAERAREREAQRVQRAAEREAAAAAQRAAKKEEGTRAACAKCISDLIVKIEKREVREEERRQKEAQRAHMKRQLSAAAAEARGERKAQRQAQKQADAAEEKQLKHLRRLRALAAQKNVYATVTTAAANADGGGARAVLRLRPPTDEERGVTALGAGLQRLCAEYKWEKNEAEPFSAQHRWQVLMGRVELYVQRELGAAYAVRSSMGCGGWAKVPWLAVSDTSESTQHGLYLQYLIRADCTAVHFCLGQGTTKLKKLFGGAAASRHLRHVGEYVRKRCRTLLGDDSPFDLEGEISLGAGSNSLADGYEKASIVSRTYTIGALPDEATLLAELRQLLAAYAAVLSDAEYIDGIKKPVDQQIADAERQKREAEAAAKNDSRLVVAAAPAAPAADSGAGFAAPAADGQAGFAAPPDTTPSKEVDAFGAAIPAPLSLTWNAALNLAFNPPDLGGWKGAKPRGGGGGAKRKRARGAAGDASSGDEPLGDDDEKVGSGFDSMSEDERRGGGDDSDEVEELDEEATAAALAGRTSSRSLQAAVLGAGGRDDDGSESPPVQPWSAEELMGGS